ncbi:hypothetical protein M9Y10_014537 [Tritrichomonas musculus]|uniref:Uncharacterized protein n=1 Tax=Tritrichomonas musculus TaxID=1915356 RepID=A0ABR2KZR6_9EUKA
MSSSTKEEEDKLTKPKTDSCEKVDLESNVNNILNALSKNVGSGTSPQQNVEYEYEEYEVEEYEEEEEEIKIKSNTKPPKKGTFMTQNISTMQPTPNPRPQPKKQKSPSPTRPMSPKRPQPVPLISNTPNYIEDESEVAAKLDQFIRDGKLPDSNSAQSMLNLINRRKVDALFSSDYESAEIYENAAQTLLNKENSLYSNTERDVKNQTRENRQQFLDNKLQLTEQRYREQIEQNNTECERRLEEAENQHQIEINEFKENWKNPDYLKQFSKPSSRMIQLRYVEKKLALAKRYSDAITQRRLGDQLQQKETESLQKSIEKQMKSDFSKMRERQRSEIERIESHYDKLNEELQAKMKKEMETITFAMKHNNDTAQIDSNNNNRRKWSIYNLGPAMNPQSSLPTPRTKKKFDQYKNERNVQIVLTPFDDATLANLPVKSFRSDRHRLRVSNPPSRCTTALSTGRSSAFASARSKSSASKPKTSKKFSVSLNSNSRSNFPNLNSNS